MTGRNSPPGCDSSDDEALEAALESLCDQIDSVELAEDLLALVPAIKARRTEHYRQFVREHQNELC